jgi:hypothetical protein
METPEYLADMDSDVPWHLFQNQIDRRWSNGFSLDTLVQNPNVDSVGAWNAQDPYEISPARTQEIFNFLPPYSPELNPKENLWDEIREKIFKNYALKSMAEVHEKLEEAILYVDRNPKLVKSITSFPYIARSF